jgi:hypothetical protein
MVDYGIEAPGRMALAALAILQDEIDGLDAGSPQAERLAVLARLAVERVSALISPQICGSRRPREGKPTPSSRSGGEQATSAACAQPTPDRLKGGAPMSDEARAAWRAVSALRRVTTGAEAEHWRSEARCLAASTDNPRIRRMCADALGDG